MNLPQTTSGKDLWERDRDRQRGQERALLYLRLLRVDGVEALEIALEALLRARQAIEKDEANPSAAAMRALRMVLEERRLALSRPLVPENRFGRICPWPELSEKVGMPSNAKSMPLLNRGSMIPDRL